MQMGQTSLTSMNLKRLVKGLVGQIDHCHHWLMMMNIITINMMTRCLVAVCTVHRDLPSVASSTLSSVQASCPTPAGTSWSWWWWWWWCWWWSSAPSSVQASCPLPADDGKGSTVITFLAKKSLSQLLWPDNSWLDGGIPRQLQVFIFFIRLIIITM